MTVLTARDVYIAAKRDNGISYLMRRFDFQNKEALLEHIRKIIPSSETIIRTLEKKQRRSERRNNTDDSCEKNNVENTTGTNQIILNSENLVTTDDEEVEVVEENCNNDTSELEISVTADEREEHIAEENNDKEAERILEQLKTQENEFSEKLYRLEVTEKELVGRKREILNPLTRLQKEAHECRNRMIEIKKQVSYIIEQASECDKQKEVTILEIRECKTALEQIREELAYRQKITILVYQNTQMEIENAELPVIDEIEIKAVFANLFCMDEAGEITVKELKTIAKLQKIVEVYRNDDRRVEVIFENEKLQNFWEILVHKG